MLVKIAVIGLITLIGYCYADDLYCRWRENHSERAYTRALATGMVADSQIIALTEDELDALIRCQNAHGVIFKTGELAQLLTYRQSNHGKYCTSSREVSHHE